MKSIAMLCVLAMLTTAQTMNNTLTWTDSPRDVFINGELDRATQVLVCDQPSYLAVLNPKLDRAIVLSINEHKVMLTPKSMLTLSADHASAASPAGFSREDSGVFVRIEGPIYVFQVAGKSFVIRPHQGMTGELSEQKLFEAMPVWQSLMDEYQPLDSAVAAIKAASKDSELILAFGTWCPDSRNYVPKLLKTLKTAANNHLKIKLIGVDHDFHEPMNTIQALGIINVPTMIVKRNGQELGRFVETPAANTIEEDLAAILEGKPPKHNGRWDRGPLLAHGSYSIRDGEGRTVGTEKFEQYRTAEMGYLIHSEILAGELSTEVWYRVDAANRPSFVEVTKKRGAGILRTRFRFDNNKTMTVRLRGNESGTSEQVVSVPDLFGVSSPAAASASWAPLCAVSNKIAMRVYVLQPEFENPMGLMEDASYEAKQDESIQVPAGEFKTRHVTAKVGGATCELWIDAELKAPVRMRTSRGFEYVLTSIEKTNS